MTTTFDRKAAAQRPAAPFRPYDLATVGRDDLFDARSDAEALPAAIPAALAGGFARGGRFAFFDAADGTRLRYAYWPAAAIASRGRVVVLGGRGEFIEKYATELVGELLVRGFEVFALDWRGQGLSQRALADPQKGHVEDFARYGEDLHRFLTTIVGRPTAPSPVRIVAHSMGGLVTLRLLADRAAERLVDAALLCAPMTGLKHAMAIRAMLLLAPPGSARATNYAPGAGTFTTYRRNFTINRVTHDERRYYFTEQWFAAEPRLTLGGPTLAWLRAGLRAVQATRRREVLGRIDVPVLLLSARLDQLVDPSTHDAVAQLCPRCTVRHYADSKHEIMMESDAIRARFWTDFESLVTAAA